MKLFCIFLKNATRKKFAIRVDIFVSKKKKHIHTLNAIFKNPFVGYGFFNELLNFAKREWEKRRGFFPNYKIIYPRLITPLKWHYDYHFFERKKNNKKQST